MGRSRRRDRRAGITPQTQAVATRARRETLGAVRRTLAAYLGGAALLAVLVLAGTVLLAGALAPWLVLAVVTAGACGLYTWASRRLESVDLVDDERMLYIMASGLLVLAVGFGVIAAVVLTLV